MSGYTITSKVISAVAAGVAVLSTTHDSTAAQAITIATYTGLTAIEWACQEAAKDITQCQSNPTKPADKNYSKEIAPGNEYK